MATRVSRPTASLRRASIFANRSGETAADNPVTFPPGRARLATNPSLTGSALLATMTTGISRVASRAA
jgi:hypothetical protein